MFSVPIVKYDFRLTFILSFSGEKNFREISDVHEMDINSVNLTNIFSGLKRHATENFYLLKYLLLVIERIFFVFWYLIKALVLWPIKGIIWLVCAPFRVVNYYFEYYIEGLLLILTTLLSFVQVNFRFNLHASRWSFSKPKAVK